MIHTRKRNAILSFLKKGEYLYKVPSKIDLIELKIQEDKSKFKNHYIPTQGIKAYVLAIHLSNHDSYQIRLIPLFTISEDKEVKRITHIQPDGTFPLNSDDNYFALHHQNGNLSFPKILSVQPAFLIGHDLGTYCMRSVIKWAKEKFDPEMSIAPLELHAMGSETPDALKRRNKFYLRSGFKIVPSSHHEHEDINDLEKIAVGWAKATVGDLLIAELRSEVISVVSTEGSNGLLALSKMIEDDIGMDILNIHRKLEDVSSTLDYKNTRIEELKNTRYRLFLYVAGIFFVLGFAGGVYLN